LPDVCNNSGREAEGEDWSCASALSFSLKTMNYDLCTLNNLTLKTKTSMAFIAIAAIILCAVTINAPSDVEGSEFRIKPSIVLSEEYNDNVLLTTEGKSDDFITRTVPSISVLYRAPIWDWDIAYYYNYQYFAQKTSSNDSTHTLDLTNKNRIIPEVLFLEVKDKYARVSLDVTRDYTQESTFVNQTDMNLLTINPYLALEPLSQMSLTAGYLYMNTWYKDPLATDRTEHIGYADVRQNLSPGLL